MTETDSNSNNDNSLDWETIKARLNSEQFFVIEIFLDCYHNCVGKGVELPNNSFGNSIKTLVNKLRDKYQSAKHDPHGLGAIWLSCELAENGADYTSFIYRCQEEFSFYITNVEESSDIDSFLMGIDDLDGGLENGEESLQIDEGFIVT